MEAERQRILEVNDQTAAKQARCEEERIAMNAEFTMRRRFAMIQRAAPVRGKNDGEKLGHRARLHTSSRRAIYILN
jgi:hypothetical protein